MIDSCERCSMSHLCTIGTTACPDLQHGGVTSGRTEIAEQAPVDDQKNNVWGHWTDRNYRPTMRDGRKHIKAIAKPRLQRGRAS